MMRLRFVALALLMAAVGAACTPASGTGGSSSATTSVPGAPGTTVLFRHPVTGLPLQATELNALATTSPTLPIVQLTQWGADHFLQVTAALSWATVGSSYEVTFVANSGGCTYPVTRARASLILEDRTTPQVRLDVVPIEHDGASLSPTVGPITLSAGPTVTLAVESVTVDLGAPSCF